MGYLGLDQTEVKDDNLFQRMFWPSDHPGETDTLGQQGFWICLAVATLSFLVLLVQGHWILALLTLLFFGLGGIGVREHSQPAAVLVAAVYLLNVVAGVFTGLPPGILQIIATLLLFANIRGTWIAAKWANSGGPEVMPDRMNATFTDKLVDQMPAKVWPWGKIVFFCVSGVYVLLTLVGVVLIATREVPRPPVPPPSVTLPVSPAR